MLLAAAGTDSGRSFDCTECSAGDTGEWEATKAHRACDKVLMSLSGRQVIARPRTAPPPPMPEAKRLEFCGRRFERCPTMLVGDFERRMIDTWCRVKNLRTLPVPGGLDDQSEVFLEAMQAIESGYNRGAKAVREEESGSRRNRRG